MPVKTKNTDTPASTAYFPENRFQEPSKSCYSLPDTACSLWLSVFSVDHTGYSESVWDKARAKVHAYIGM